MCISDTNVSDDTTSSEGLDWVPASCTLPTAEQPFRVAEFDDLFATAVRAVERIDPTTLRMTVDAAADDQARDLAERESSCCSFFGFDFHPNNASTVSMQVSVPDAHVAVLDAFAARVATAAGLGVGVAS